jgi:acyl CoA:acetate/3-ketoacid CoA transferase beta subunit
MEVAETEISPTGKSRVNGQKGMGGAMDLVASAENIIVAMMHVNKGIQNSLKWQPPLTGVGCVKK